MVDKIQQAADRLWKASQSGTTCDPVRDLIGDMNLSAAYEVQEINTKRKLNSGAQIVGYKAGLTSVAVQQQLGVDQPDYGILFDEMNVAQGTEISAAQVMQPKVETEIAFIMGDDLNSEQLNSADIIASVDYALASFEIVGSRVSDWDIKIYDTIADNASSGVFVLGDQARKLEEFDLLGCQMAMQRRGEVVSTGSGAQCLGSPVLAALWLAKTMAGVGRPIKKGDILLTGALGPMVSVAPGDVMQAEIGGLGSVSATFT